MLAQAGTAPRRRGAGRAQLAQMHALGTELFPPLSKQWNSRTSGIKAVESRVASGLPDILLTPPASLKLLVVGRSRLFPDSTD